VRKALQKPKDTVDRELRALQLLGAVSCDEEVQYDKDGNEQKPKWLWLLAEGINPEVLSCAISATPPCREEGSEGSTTPPGDTPYTYPYARVAEFARGSEGDLSCTVNGDGRCEQCGFHVATQGHSDSCAEPNSTNGQCRDCRTKPHSAGRPRCEQCHRVYLTTVDGYDR
jgi:hypothetical protein